VSFIPLKLARFCVLVLLLVFATFAAPALAAPPTKSWVVHWQPAKLVNGSPVIFQVSAPVHVVALSGKWLDHEVFFFHDLHSSAWYGIAGIALDTPAGTHTLTLQANSATGTQLSIRRSVTIRHAKYPSIKIKVAKEFVSPSPEQVQRIDQEKALKQRLFATVDPDRLWSGNFHAPVIAHISDLFGTARVLNGKAQSVHQGLDYAVPEGTAVSALNRGTVLLARPLFFEGNCVILDHGQGLFSLYMHLSKINVQEGDQIASGQPLGLSGGTGRVTGPHLHIAVRWQGVYLNPATLLQLRIP